MNLHIVPDSKYINTFCANLNELGILQNNKVIVRSKKKPRYITHDLPWAPLYSSQLKNQVGDTTTLRCGVYPSFFSTDVSMGGEPFF